MQMPSSPRKVIPSIIAPAIKFPLLGLMLDCLILCFLGNPEHLAVFRHRHFLLFQQLLTYIDLFFCFLNYKNGFVEMDMFELPLQLLPH